MRKEGLARVVIEALLGIALVSGLLLAGWTVYRRLPSDGSVPINVSASDPQAQTKLTVVLRGEIAGATLNSPVELYPFDLAAAQREFQASPRLARQFDDFLMRQMHGITVVKATSDGPDRASANLSAGSWWLHATATLNNDETIEWRIPVNVGSQEQTVELTLDNAYERTKKF